MKISSPLFLVLVTVFVSVAGTMLALEIFSNEPPIEGTVPATIRSAILNEDREYFIHLPEGYDSDTTRQYPVLYVLDGTSQSGHTAESAALLARVGLIPPMIVVGVPSIDSDTRNRDYTPPDMRLDTDDTASKNGSADKFLSHLKTELIPTIEREYRTTHPRMLAGWSRGGLFAVYSQVVAPALFDARFAHSPALWRENNLMVRQLEQVLSVSPTNKEFLFLSMGDQESEDITAAFQDTVSVLKRSAGGALRWKAYTSIEGTHESNPQLSTPVGLCAMFNTKQLCGLTQ